MSRKIANTTADPTIEFAALEIDGETYRLCYDFGAIAEAEKLTGCNLLQGIAYILVNGATASQFRGLFYAALRKAHPKMTIAEADRLVRIDTMADIRTAIETAYTLSMPEAKRIREDPTEGVAAPPS